MKYPNKIIPGGQTCVDRAGLDAGIEIDLEKTTLSSSGKTLVVTSIRGNTVTKVEIDGKPVTIGLNAYIKP